MITKEKIATIAFKVAIILLLLLMLAFTFGCGSKKKLIQKSQFTTEMAKVERVNELVENSVVSKMELTGASEKLTEKEAENFQAEIDDPTKKASITKKEKDGETTWELDNIKNFNTGKEKSKEQSKDTSAVKQSKIAKSKKTKDSEAETKGKASGKEKEIDLKVERGFPWHWVILAVLLYSIFSYFGKSFNPFKWF